MTEKEKQALENASIVTDQESLIERTIEMKVEQKTCPVITRMDNIIDRFDKALPFLEDCGRRHDNHTAWLVGLTAAIFIVGVILFIVAKKVQYLT